MEMNDRFEDEIWEAMWAARLPPPEKVTPERDVLPDSPREPGPAQPSTPSPSPPPHHLVDSRQTEVPAIFLPPGLGRTPQQIAAAAELNAAVTARARQQEEAERARRARLAASIEETGDLGNHGGRPDVSGRQGSRRSERQNQQPQYPRTSPQQSDFPHAAALMPMPISTPIFPHPETTLQALRSSSPSGSLSTNPIQQEPSSSPQQLANNDSGNALGHFGDSIFAHMMNELISREVLPRGAYRQVPLPSTRPIPFGMEFLFYGELVGPDHWLFSKARDPWSQVRAVRSARNGIIVGWQDSHAPRAGGVYLFPTPGQSGEPSRGRRRR
jgi:hypothetical protein